MRITILYQYFQGMDAPGHTLILELAKFLIAKGHEVMVVAGETGYMSRQKPQLPWWRRLYRREIVEGVPVIRTYTYPELHNSYLGRLVSFLSFTLTSPFGLLSGPRPDVVLASSPPIFPVFSTWLTCWIRHIPLVFEVRDLWPASAVELGVVRNRVLVKIMTWIEKCLYNNAVKIVALTEGIKKDIVQRGWPAHKIAVITCSVDFSMLYPDAMAGERVRESMGWNRKHIVMYLGAHGRANNLSVVLRAAKRLSERSDILFVLIGDGMEKPLLQAAVRDMKLQNILFHPAISKREVGSYLNAADVCLATLQDIPLFAGAIPTKLLEYMVCGCPVLVGIQGETKKIVEGPGAGMTFEPDDDEQLAARLCVLLDNQQQRDLMGQCGLQYVKENYSGETIHCKMLSLLQEAAKH